MQNGGRRCRRRTLKALVLRIRCVPPLLHITQNVFLPHKRIRVDLQMIFNLHRRINYKFNLSLTLFPAYLIHKYNLDENCMRNE